MVFDDKDGGFAQIEIVGNMGRENRYKSLTLASSTRRK